jgi:hypothetical protein
MYFEDSESFTFSGLDLPFFLQSAMVDLVGSVVPTSS